MKILVFTFYILLFPFLSFSCDRSSVSLISVTPVAGNFLITYQICIGEGLTGVNRGGDGDTRNFVIGIYSNSPITVSGYTPASVTGTVTGTVQTGGVYGPQGPPFDSDETIAYFDFTSSPSSFACVSSTVNCGNTNTRCDVFSFTSSVIPDSIRVFGVEGAGNYVAGCYPNFDMLIDFSVALNVTWGNLIATDIERSNVRLDWSTLSEKNNDYFIIQKLDNTQHAWWDISTIDGMGTTDQLTNYSYTDEYVSNGHHYYRIKQVDYDGKYTLSKTVSIIKNNEGYIAVELSPNPVIDKLNISGAKNRDYEILSSEGKIVDFGFIKNNSYTIPIKGLDDGVYFLKMVSESNQEVIKFIVQH